ncbi:MAG: sugar ABC transporter substrate-binding protein, partial [Pseudomonadota bacterium]
MISTRALGAAAVASLWAVGGAQAADDATTITIATVNNGDMIRMQGLTDDFTAKTGHQVEWVTLEENVLRQRVTTDITTKGGAFDIMT